MNKNIQITVCRADFWGSREPGGEPSELDQRQPESPDVHWTHREVCRVQKPTGEMDAHKLIWRGGIKGSLYNKTYTDVFILLTSCVSVCPVPSVSYLLPVCYRTICWGGRRPVRWLKETKRLCWRSVCFLPLHTGASLDPHLIVLRMAASADIPEVEVQVKHTHSVWRDSLSSWASILIM